MISLLRTFHCQACVCLWLRACVFIRSCKIIHLPEEKKHTHTHMHSRECAHKNQTNKQTNTTKTKILKLNMSKLNTKIMSSKIIYCMENFQYWSFKSKYEYAHYTICKVFIIIAKLNAYKYACIATIIHSLYKPFQVAKRTGNLSRSSYTVHTLFFHYIHKQTGTFHTLICMIYICIYGNDLQTKFENQKRKEKRVCG